MRRPHFPHPRTTRPSWIQFVSLLLCYALLSPCFAALSSGTKASAPGGERNTFEQFEQGALNELLVKFRDGASENAKNSVARSYGSRRGKKLRGESALEKMDVPVGQSAEAFARLLSSDPAIEFAEPNFLIKLDQFQTENTESISGVTAH